MDDLWTCVATCMDGLVWIDVWTYLDFVWIMYVIMDGFVMIDECHLWYICDL